jgi:hypothetical protein
MTNLRQALATFAFFAPAYPAEFTGELPSAYFGEDFGGREDFCRDRIGWSGNIDAPERIAAGSTSNRNYDGVPASSNFVR